MDLDSAIALLEQQVAAMSRALVAQDATAAEAAAAELRNSLRTAMAPFAQAQRSGCLAPDLQRRLARARGEIAAQREGVARASAMLDQTLTAMLPQPDAPMVYSARGGASRSSGRVIAAS